MPALQSRLKSRVGHRSWRCAKSDDREYFCNVSYLHPRSLISSAPQTEISGPPSGSSQETSKVPLPRSSKSAQALHHLIYRTRCCGRRSSTTVALYHSPSSNMASTRCPCAGSKPLSMHQDGPTSDSAARCIKLFLSPPDCRKPSVQASMTAAQHEGLVRRSAKALGLHLDHPTI